MFLHPFLPQKKLFKAYDIRGEIGLFTDDFLWALANGFATLFTDNTAANIVIGYDVRHYSQYIAKFIAYACQLNAIEVIWLGQVTTPMMAYMANQYSGNGIMVTASHSEKHINGIKWLVNHESPSSQDITKLYYSLLEQPLFIPSSGLIETIQHSSFEQKTAYSFNHYTAGILTAINSIDKPRSVLPSQPPFHLVIDCMNGATSHFAETLFKGLGHQCAMLNHRPDGDFPKGNPDPTENGRLSELSQAVITYKADMGLAFDGDGDRLVVIDRHGAVVAPDHLLYLLARIAIEECCEKPSSAEVIFDVKCSHHIPTLIAAQGAVPVMEKTGSSLMRKSLQNKSRHSIFAGELSGHFLFNDGYFVLHDDAMYAAVRLLHWLSYQTFTLEEIISRLPRCVSTADMYLPIKDEKVENNFFTALLNFTTKPYRSLKNAFNIQNVCTIDGLRLDFTNGFGVLRRSNTGNYLTVRFSGNTLTDLQAVQSVFVGLCRTIDDDLATQVANIKPI